MGVAGLHQRQTAFACVPAQHVHGILDRNGVHLAEQSLLQRQHFQLQSAGLGGISAVTFPEGYGDSTDAEGNTITLSGKEAVFSVTLNAITQSVVPTLTDKWVETNFAASDDLHTADALRQYFDSALYANNLDNAAMDYLLTNSTFKEVPTQITSYYIRMFLNYHSQLATQYGMELDAYAQAKGYADADAMLADSDAYFEHLAKQDLVFQAIAEQLDITPTQEQIDSANSSYADTYGAQRSMLNALQLAVLDKVEESAVLS